MPDEQPVEFVEIAPNARVHGRDGTVSALTTMSRFGCQAVEINEALLLAGGAVEWVPCGLPTFASVYAGVYDTEADADEQPVLCWRHLRVLGDTADLIVRPFTKHDALREAAGA